MVAALQQQAAVCNVVEGVLFLSTARVVNKSPQQLQRQLQLQQRRPMQSCF